MPKDATSHVIENIETIARLDREFLERRTTVERIADSIGAFVGKQNRMSQRAEQRDHLLQMLRAICDQPRPRAEAGAPEVRELSEKTALDSVARHLRDRIPD